MLVSSPEQALTSPSISSCLNHLGVAWRNSAGKTGHGWEGGGKTNWNSGVPPSPWSISNPWGGNSGPFSFGSSGSQSVNNSSEQFSGAALANAMRAEMAKQREADMSRSIASGVA